jgi:iron complex transport system substrate-binding protein
VSESTSAPLSFTNSLGSFTLDAPATRVVALSEEAADFLITLGIQPIGFSSGRVTGAASGQPYEQPHFFPKELLGSPVFLGSEESPSLELVSSLKPDLIVSGSWAQEANEKLAQIAPTYVVDQALEGYWRETLQEIGRLLGREPQAQQFIADYDATAKRLAEELAPVAESSPDVLFLYSYAPSDGTVLLGPGWAGSKPLELLGFNVLAPTGFDLSNGGSAPVSPEIVNEVDADIVFVIRINEADGVISRYPVDTLLDSLKDSKVIYQHIPSTRTSTAPYTDLFVLKETAGLLREASASLPGVLVGRVRRIIAARPPQFDVLGWAMFCARLGDLRQIDHKAGALAGRATDLDMPIALAHNAMNARQAQPGA